MDLTFSYVRTDQDAGATVPAALLSSNMKIRCNVYFATLGQLFIALLLLWLTRFLFYFYNVDVIGEISTSQLWVLAFRGLPFDISTLAYANALFILMRFMPFDFTMHRWWRISEMIVYGICNSVLLIINIGDTAFFRFNGGRLRLDGFLSLLNADMFGTMLGYAGQYLWAFLTIAAVVGLLMFLATRFAISGMARRRGIRVTLLISALVITFFAMRCTISGRPIGIDRAAAIADKPTDINVILNSPFCILRSANYSKGVATMTFFSDKELTSMRTSIQQPSIPLAADSIKEAVSGKNIMLIVLESGAQLWFDSLNIIDGESPRGLMPFLDSIAANSFAITNTYCTGGRTIEGFASLTGGIPTFGQMKWMTTKYGVMPVDAPASLLAEKGYSTEFIIGANPDHFTLGPQARAFGFKKVIGRYDVSTPADESNCAGWGYWDHFMGPYAAKEITKLQQPFFACWLTLYLHSPFHFPKHLRLPGYKPVDSDIERSVEYMDYSLRQFFAEARSQPWFDNTLFVITSDHGFRDLTEPKYNGAYIYGHVPMLFYTPDGSLPVEKHPERPMAQFDIATTILWLAGYDRSYIGVGTNWFDDSKPHYGIQQRNNTWNVTSSRYHIVAPLSADRIDAVYDITVDQQLLNPLPAGEYPEAKTMLRWLQAFLQDYTTRLNNARLAI